MEIRGGVWTAGEMKIGNEKEGYGNRYFRNL